LFITFFAGIGTITSAILLYVKFRPLGVRHLNFVSLGMVMLGLLPLSFTPQAFLLEEKYSDFMTVLTIIGAVSTISGLMMITWNLKIHQTVEIPKRFVLLLPIYGIIISQIITGSKVTWDGETWVIVRPTLVRVLLFSGTAWILIELMIVFYVGLRVSNDPWYWLAIALPVGLMASYVLLALRETLSFSLVFYQIPTGLATIAFSISIIKAPQLLIIPTIKVQSITIALRDSGLSTLTFPDSSDQSDKSMLNAAAITGITGLIKQIAGKENLPPTLGYADFIIKIYPEDTIFIYSISNGEHPLLDGFVSLLTKKWAKRMEDFTGKITPSDRTEFNEDILRTLKIFI
ncbi:MAG: hypothetical protein IH840_11195, partial [Candidatus Heimdallarchaeota archaeon]|nr:hypothetical protein [Candidatus Heimdallarchaeota archaeon]